MLCFIISLVVILRCAKCAQTRSPATTSFWCSVSSVTEPTTRTVSPRRLQDHPRETGCAVSASPARLVECPRWDGTTLEWKMVG